MLDFLSGVWKSLFGKTDGSGETQLGRGNRNISGVTIGDTGGHVVVGNEGTVHFNGTPPSPPKLPVVSVRGAVAIGPFGESLSFLSVEFLNTTDRSYFVNTFALRLRDDTDCFVKQNAVTGEPNGSKREVRPGDSYSFLISAADLRGFNRPPEDFVFAVVYETAGGVFKSADGELSGFVRTVTS